MKTFFLRGLSVCLFTVLVCLSITGVSAFLDKTDVDEKYKQFFEAETNFDVIFLGTSHTYNTILPQELWKNHGIPSYNWGQSNCTVPIDYYVLQMLCQYTSPKLVVIDLFGLAEYADIGNGKYRTDARDQQRVQFDAFPLSRLKAEAVWDIFDDYGDRWDFLFPLAIYHNRWSEIRKDNFSPRDIPQKGAAFVLGVTETDYREQTAASSTSWNTETTAMKYLLQIADFCKAQGISLLFTYLPFAAEEESVQAAAAFEDYFRQEFLLQYPDSEYLNMLSLGIPDYSTDVYTDVSHLNYIGAAAVTDWLGGYLAEHYPDTVRRGEEAYAHWDSDYDHYVNYKISRFKEGDLYNNLQLLYGMDFHGTLTVPADMYASLDEDRLLGNLRRRLGDRITVEAADDGNEPSAGTMVLTVTDNRNGEEVFRTVIVK